MQYFLWYINLIQYTYHKWCLYHQHSDNKQNHGGDKEKQIKLFSYCNFKHSSSSTSLFQAFFVVTQWLHLNIAIAGTTIGCYCWWKKPLWHSGFHNYQISHLLLSICNYYEGHQTSILVKWEAADSMTPSLGAADRFKPHVNCLTSLEYSHHSHHWHAYACSLTDWGLNVAAILELSQMTCNISPCLC